MSAPERDALLQDVGTKLVSAFGETAEGYAVLGGALARRNEKGKLLPRAIMNLEKAVELNPIDAESWFYLGNARFELTAHVVESSRRDQLDAALAALTRAIDLAPSNFEAYQVRGVIEANLGRRLDALSDLTEGARLAEALLPKEPEQHVDRPTVDGTKVAGYWGACAQQALLAERFPLAAEAASHMLRLAPDNAKPACQALLDAAQGALGLGDRATAKTALDRLPVRLDPELARRRDELVSALGR